jgi:diadenosine tetraphosphate (Ap4A) HIT family hydrolase
LAAEICTSTGWLATSACSRTWAWSSQGVAASVARQDGLDAFRTVINSGAEAGQTVFHLHVHVIGGRSLAWPPG